MTQPYYGYGGYYGGYYAPRYYYQPRYYAPPPVYYRDNGYYDQYYDPCADGGVVSRPAHLQC